MSAAVAAVVVAVAVGARDDDQVGAGPEAGPATGGALSPGRSCSYRLSFVSERSGRKQIYALDIRRPRKVVQVTQVSGHAFDPTWSPDGTRVAFRWFRARNSSVGVYVADADGSDVELVARHGVTPSWSPDGRFIAHASAQGISIVDVDEALRREPSASRVLVRATPSLPKEYPAWSADGRRLVFSGYAANGTYDIWVVEADGSNLRDLTPRDSLDYGATWSPDGRRIVFGSSGTTPGGADRLFVMSDDGTNVRPLARGAAPAWSPDGRWIAFVSSRGGNADVYIMRPDGSNERRLTSHPAFDTGPPAWVGRC